MATSTYVLTRIVASLREIAVESDFLPELVAGWAEEPETSRASWQLEWYELLSRLAELDREYRAGSMTAAQQDRFLALLAKVQGQAVLLKRIGVDSRFPLGSDEAIG